jgi:Lysozyme like domain
MTFEELVSLWKEACPDLSDKAEEMACVALAESGGNPNAKNNNENPFSEDRGLWQINSNAWPQFNPPYDLFDARANAEAARVVLLQQGITAWSTYENGSAQKIGKQYGIPF